MLYQFFVRYHLQTSRALTSALLIGILMFFVSTPSFGQDDEKGDDPVAVFNEAQNLHEKGDLAGAIALYEKALKIEPNFPEAQYQIGTAKLALGKNAEAESAFHRALELKPDWTLPMTSLGAMLAKRGEVEEADRLLSKVVKLEPQNAVALIALSDLRRRYMASPKTLEMMLVNLSAMTGRGNASSSLWSARADVEIALHKMADARSSVARSLLLDPKYEPALYQAASLAVADGDHDRARQYAASIEALRPGSDGVKQLRATIAANEGKLDDALKFLDSMATPGSEAAELRNNINTARTTSPADLEKQLEKTPKDPLILGRLCTLFRRDDPEKALGYCRRASEAEPGNVNHAVGFGAALVQGKQYDAAVGIFRKILEIVPDNFTAHANLASALYQLKRYPEARAEFEWLIRAQPGSAGAYLLLGIIQDEAGEFADALANYQRYLKLADPAINKLDIEKVNLRLPSLQKQIKEKKGKK